MIYKLARAPSLRKNNLAGGGRLQAIPAIVKLGMTKVSVQMHGRDIQDFFRIKYIELISWPFLVSMTTNPS